VFANPLRSGVRLRLGGRDKRHGFDDDDSPSVGVDGGGVKVLYENVRGKTRGGRPEGCCSIVICIGITGNEQCQWSELM